MNIVYIHGFASAVKPSHEKYDALAALGKVHPIAPDYTQALPNIIQAVDAFCRNIGRVDLVIGTSMGGYTAASIGNKLGIPFVALNPSIKPSLSLAKYQLDYPELKNVLNSYPDFDISNTSRLGRVFVNLGDTVINPNDTVRFMQANNIQVVVLDGGCHRFANIHDVITPITQFLALQPSL